MRFMFLLVGEQHPVFCRFGSSILCIRSPTHPLVSIFGTGDYGSHTLRSVKARCFNHVFPGVTHVRPVLYIRFDLRQKTCLCTVLTFSVLVPGTLFKMYV